MAAVDPGEFSGMPGVISGIQSPTCKQCKRVSRKLNLIYTDRPRVAVVVEW